MRVEVFGRTWLFITDEHFIREAMMSRTAPFPKFLDDGGLVLPMLGNDASVKSMAMSALPTPYVKAVRRIYASAFQTSRLKDAMTKMNNVIEEMFSVIESRRLDGPIDFQDLFVRMAMDAIGHVGLEMNLGGLDGSRDLHHLMLKAGYISLQRTRNLAMIISSRLLPASKGVQRQTAVIDKLMAEWEQLANEILQRELPSDGSVPIWLALRQLIDPETGQRIPFRTLAVEVATVVVGGMDTTGHQLGWLFALLAAHPDVISKLLEELRLHGLYGAHAREITFEDLGELAYLTAVIKEGMRTAYVACGSFLRIVPEDTTIVGYRIPKNTLIMCPSTRALNESKEEWGDPQNFRPERWLSDEDMSHKYNFAFSFGPRDCIGQKLAMMEMRLVIAKLVMQYRFSLEGDVKEILSNARDGLVTEACDGIWLHVTPRPPDQ